MDVAPDLRGHLRSDYLRDHDATTAAQADRCHYADRAFDRALWHLWLLHPSAWHHRSVNRLLPYWLDLWRAPNAGHLPLDDHSAGALSHADTGRAKALAGPCGALA